VEQTLRIPVFVSCPTKLSIEQNKSRQVVLDLLEKYKFQPRALGRSDYPNKAALREVVAIARHCAGAVIMGFVQYQATQGTVYPGSEWATDAPRAFPSPWNDLEAGILYLSKLPLMILREPGVTGGIFDQGVTEYFTHTMPTDPADERFEQSLLSWQADVRTNYFAW
jgi:hypothetical protein